MNALHKFYSLNKQHKEKIEECECGNHGWEKYLNGRPEVLINKSCCDRKTLQHLSIEGKDPTFLQWDCVVDDDEKNLCQECGVKKKLGVTDCDIWSNCCQEIDVMEWIEAPRQGMTNGKQNTQLELGQRRHPVKEVINRFVEQLNTCRLHLAELEWKRWMMKRDLLMSNSDTHRIICTDFGASLDLKASETDNSSVDHHAVVAIFFVVIDWRVVKYRKENGEMGEKIITTWRNGYSLETH